MILGEDDAHPVRQGRHLVLELRRPDRGLQRRERQGRDGDGRKARRNAQEDMHNHA
jgi:hypothetical protein